MKQATGSYDIHVFVCTNTKKGECCAQHGAEEIRKDLKEWSLARPEWKKRIRINASGCLHCCSEGVAVAIYPENRWFLQVRGESTAALKAEIEKMMGEVITSETENTSMS